MVKLVIAKKTRRKVEYVWLVSKTRLAVKSNIVRTQKKEKHIGSLNLLNRVRNKWVRKRKWTINGVTLVRARLQF